MIYTVISKYTLVETVFKIFFRLNIVETKNSCFSLNMIFSIIMFVNYLYVSFPFLCFLSFMLFILTLLLQNLSSQFLFTFLSALLYYCYWSKCMINKMWKFVPKLCLYFNQKHAILVLYFLLKLEWSAFRSTFVAYTLTVRSFNCWYIIWSNYSYKYCAYILHLYTCVLWWIWWIHNATLD